MDDTTLRSLVVFHSAGYAHWSAVINTHGEPQPSDHLKNTLIALKRASSFQTDRQSVPITRLVQSFQDHNDNHSCRIDPLLQMKLAKLKAQYPDVQEFRAHLTRLYGVKAIHVVDWKGEFRKTPDEIIWALCYYSTTWNRLRRVTFNMVMTMSALLVCYAFLASRGHHVRNITELVSRMKKVRNRPLNNFIHETKDGRSLGTQLRDFISLLSIVLYLSSIPARVLWTLCMGTMKLFFPKWFGILEVLYGKYSQVIPTTVSVVTDKKDVSLETSYYGSLGNDVHNLACRVLLAVPQDNQITSWTLDSAESATRVFVQSLSGYLTRMQHSPLHSHQPVPRESVAMMSSPARFGQERELPTRV